MNQLGSEDYWDLFWDQRLQNLQNLGKREAILAVSELIRRMAPEWEHKLRLLELGCGEGQVIGPLVEGHAALVSAAGSLGVDYLPASLKSARRAYASLPCRHGDFSDEQFCAGLGQFEIVLLVNALHEVFSFTFSEELGEVDRARAKERVRLALGNAARCVAPGGWLVVFDGLEAPGNPDELLRVRFRDPMAFEHFKTFAREYRPFHIRYESKPEALTIEIPRFYFTRYLTKSIFLGKALWQSERLESYQYFNEAEFRAAFATAGLEIPELRMLTVDEDKWQRNVEILSPGEGFPEEHILIQAQKSID
jgi:SAM-dependent methyltransferase